MKTLFLKIYNRIDRRAFVFSLLFSLFVFFFERAVFRVDYRNYVFDIFNIGNLVVILITLIILFSLFCFFLFIYFSFTSSWRYKIVYFLIFAFAVFHEYSYQNVFGRFSTLNDLQIAFATTSEQKLNAIATYFSLIAIIPCVVYLLMLITIKSKHITRGLKSFLVIAILFIGFYASVWRISYYFSFPTVSIGTFARSSIGYSIFRFYAYKEKRDSVEQPTFSDSYRPNNNIVFIVDESIRGDHLSLNGYPRQTTPFLDELSKRGLLKNWGIAVSASTCSIYTHDILLTGFTPDDFPDPDEKINKAPLIFQYARAMRYKTYYLDGQMDSFWGALEYDGNFYVDVRVDISSFNKKGAMYWETDFEIAKKVNEILSSSSGNFIFIFKKGVHFPYNYIFPPDETIWKPSYVGNTPYKLPPEEHDSIVNSYDNGIKYNSDNFFKNLASDYGNLPNNTVILYTGDHGQTLGEGGKNYPHCGDSRNEAMVPLFIIGNLGKEVDTKFKPIHANIFATMLDLMNYPESLRKRQYAISLLKAKESDSKERYYVPANFKGGDMNFTKIVKLKFD
jgi:glucan phosphoethanolaminetransferase (alkaline phosphatase superfamily)